MDNSQTIENITPNEKKNSVQIPVVESQAIKSPDQKSVNLQKFNTMSGHEVTDYTTNKLKNRQSMPTNKPSNENKTSENKKTIKSLNLDKDYNKYKSSKTKSPNAISPNKSSIRENSIDKPEVIKSYKRTPKIMNTLNEEIQLTKKEMQSYRRTQYTKKELNQMNKSIDFLQRKSYEPKLQSLRHIMVPLSNNDFLRRMFLKELNIVEFCNVSLKNYNNLLTKIDSANPDNSSENFILKEFIKEFIRFCNKVSLKYFEENIYDGAYTLLKLCLDFISNSKKEENEFLDELVLTYNNLAICMKFYKQYKQSITYSTTILKLERTRGSVNYESLCQTENNICAVYSQMGEHNKAIDHAIMALKVVDAASANNAIVNYNDAAHKATNATNTLTIEKFYEIKSITCYNLAVEFEYMNDLREALNWYRQACDTYDKAPDAKSHYINYFQLGYRNCRDSILKQVKQKKYNLDDEMNMKLTEGFGKNTFSYCLKMTKDYYDAQSNTVKDVKHLTKTYLKY